MSTDQPKASERSSDQKFYTAPPSEHTPTLSRKDPSVPVVIGNSSKIPPKPGALPPKPGALPPKNGDPPKEPWHKRLRCYLYNRSNGTFCERTCISWLQFVTYGVMYLMFLTTFTLLLLYISLVIINNTRNGEPNSLSELLIYSPENVGLTATPLSENSYPLIWYRNGEPDDYQRYVSAIDRLMVTKREKRNSESNLGPCSKSPYGYGDQPCIIIRINKRMNWNGRPLKYDSPRIKEAPEDVQNWAKKDSNMFWLHCSGFNNYDKEHLGNIKYYPEPPGLNSDLFPLSMERSSPLVAIQLSNFTMGLSLAIECNLWYESGVSSLAFMFYVSPKMRRNFTQGYSV